MLGLPSENHGSQQLDLPACRKKNFQRVRQLTLIELCKMIETDNLCCRSRKTFVEVWLGRTRFDMAVRRELDNLGLNVVQKWVIETHHKTLLSSRTHSNFLRYPSLIMVSAREVPHNMVPPFVALQVALCVMWPCVKHFLSFSISRRVYQ